MNLARYAVAKSFDIPIIKRAVQDFAVGADWTPAAGDVKLTLDGGTPTDITSLPTAKAAGNGAFWIFALTTGELTAKRITISVIDAATKAVEDQLYVIETYGHEDAMHPNLAIEVPIYGKFITGTLSDNTCTTNLTYANDILQKRRLVILSGSLAGESTFIADNSVTSGQLWFMTRLSGTPANNDRFVII